MDFNHIRNYIFLGILFLVTVIFCLILQPFIYPIFWAAVIAALFNPVYKRLNSFFKHPNLSSSLSILLVVIIILLPITILGLLLFRESFNLYERLSTNQQQIRENILHLAETIKHNSVTARLQIDESFLTDKIGEVTQDISVFMFKEIKDFTQNSLTFLVMFVIMLYALFFFIRDGEKLLKKIMHLSPIGKKYEVMLYEKFTETASATIKGTIFVGGLQGTIGGIMLALVGIKSALICGIFMIFFSIIPGIGSAIIWFPAALFLIFTGHVWAGIFVILFGTFFIGTIDNLLRPILVGKDAEMHPLLILLSTLGGIGLFGVSGFLMGPIIAALFVSFWKIYEEFYHKELLKN
jgi:predicted PurR-regulated permease PerM